MTKMMSMMTMKIKNKCVRQRPRRLRLGALSPPPPAAARPQVKRVAQERNDMPAAAARAARVGRAADRGRGAFAMDQDDDDDDEDEDEDEEDQALPARKPAARITASAKATAAKTAAKAPAKALAASSPRAGKAKAKATTGTPYEIACTANQAPVVPPSSTAMLVTVGTVLTDFAKKEYQLTRLLGVGGHGAVYEAKPKDGTGSVAIKIEPIHTKKANPLDSESKIYQTLGKQDNIDKFVKSQRGVSSVGMPLYHSYGKFTTSKGQPSQFIVVALMGPSIQQLFELTGAFTRPTLDYIANAVILALQYVHSFGFVFADIKASNLMLGAPGSSNAQDVYLVDFGIAERYMFGGKHVVYDNKKKAAFDGTLEYASTDVHEGYICSRRSDLQSLGFLLVKLELGALPWAKQTQKNAVLAAKQALLADPRSFKCSAALTRFFALVEKIKYTEEPNYKELRDLFPVDKKAVLDWQ
ncbi:Ser/Thr kinase [Capsaspora owczarzaki ATCC 30864]|uniref:Ser/Thr kinase n=1 Tax=Capsaspora owczarzaki (strain ATCC 30864) TaxID=595528 RepID=UPI0001FE281E|nr:Ser/Thr kinase [Capsaspora owczarzaki ATCC 30864]|eukprot:XP_004343426.1 Ser/Thr kinase [Capsaspora owczarzaki ATCC 30864]